MSATHTDERILKLAEKGLSPEQIARKIGRPGPEGVERVRATIERDPRLRRAGSRRTS